MAPLTHQLRVLGEPGLCPPVLGPGLPELASAWHKLYLYSLIGEGPPSLLIPKVSLKISYNDNIPKINICIRVGRCAASQLPSPWPRASW